MTVRSSKIAVGVAGAPVAVEATPPMFMSPETPFLKIIVIRFEFMGQMATLTTHEILISATAVLTLLVLGVSLWRNITGKSKP